MATPVGGPVGGRIGISLRGRLPSEGPRQVVSCFQGATMGECGLEIVSAVADESRNPKCGGEVMPIKDVGKGLVWASP